jgi:hypothetical protein
MVDFMLEKKTLIPKLLFVLQSPLIRFTTAIEIIKNNQIEKEKTIMVNYEKMDGSEVKRLAKQGNDKEALFEMSWRPELMPSGVDSQDPVYRCAWQDYWFEKAADAGNIDAKSRYARSLVDRIMNAEDRQKAMKYFESLLADYNAGKLVGESEIDGILAQFWLGIMLCEGYHTQRDVARGVKLLEAAHAKTNGFEKFGYRFHRTLGELYATGMAQPGEDPSVADLEKAIKYLETAISRFNPEKDDPNNRGFLQLTKDMFQLQKKRIVNTMIIRGDKIVDLSDAEKNERRRRMMEVSSAAQQRTNADKAALTQIRQQLAREGW